jgi:DNA repair exonuclease SbcCD nuclease subunit
MARILFIGDPHIRHTHLSEGVTLLRWIESVIETKKPDVVVNLGDTLDTHSIIRAEVLSTVNDHLNRVADLKIPMIMVLGNHDMYKPNSSKYHALEVFKGRKNLVVVDDIAVLDGITYVPYLSDPSSWPDITTDIAVTHNTFMGADYGFKLADKGIPVDQVRCDLVVSGHIHKHQTLQSVFYPGTPIATSASDANQTKGLHILDIDTLDKEFIESPFPMWRTRDLFVGQDDDLNFTPKDIWMVKLIGPRAEIKAFLDSKKVQDLKKTVKITFKAEFTDSAKVSKTSISAPTPIAMVEQYLDKVYSGSIDKELLKLTIKNYMEKT